tara:strand:+ start:38 stop:184 length:147 start_codon:yes stop_codon:yes gene_type:complete
MRVKNIDCIIPINASDQTMVKRVFPLSLGNASKHTGVNEPAIIINIPQ